MALKSPITCHGMYVKPHFLHMDGRGTKPLNRPPLVWDRATVLDSSIGKPAQGVKVQLLAPSVPGPNPTSGGVWIGIGASTTNADGRCLDLLSPNPASDSSSYTLQPGTYQIVFETKEYFERTGRKSFYPFVQVGGDAPSCHPSSG